MTTNIKTIEELNLVVWYMMGAVANVVSSNVYKLPTSELDKIPVIGFTKDQYDLINSMCMCIDISEDLRVYSCGGLPFKIHITN